MKIPEGEKAQIRAFLTSALDRHECLVPRPVGFTPGESASVFCQIGEWIGLEATAERKINAPARCRTPGRPGGSLITILTEQYGLHLTWALQWLTPLQ
jgi:hypothetical protein